MSPEENPISKTDSKTEEINMVDVAKGVVKREMAETSDKPEVVDVIVDERSFKVLLAGDGTSAYVYLQYKKFGKDVHSCGKTREETLQDMEKSIEDAIAWLASHYTGVFVDEVRANLKSKANLTGEWDEYRGLSTLEEISQRSFGPIVAELRSRAEFKEKFKKSPWPGERTEDERKKEGL